MTKSQIIVHEATGDRVGLCRRTEDLGRIRKQATTQVDLQVEAPNRRVYLARKSDIDSPCKHRRSFRTGLQVSANLAPDERLIPGRPTDPPQLLVGLYRDNVSTGWVLDGKPELENRGPEVPAADRNEIG